MRRLILLTPVVLLAATPAPSPRDQIEFQGPPGSVTPNLAAGRDGRILLSWLEPAGNDRHALRLAVRERGRWSPPVTVRESDRFFVNWADFASVIETADGQWVVHWLEKTAARPYAYHVMLSVSSDRGRSWSEPFPAHRDLSPTEHGFVAMLPRPRGGADIAWLDGRAMEGTPRGPMSVRFTSFDGSARLGPEIELDDRVCECCQVAMARTSSGLVVAYRDRSESEIRDIAIVRERAGGWTRPVVVAADHWEHRACPVNGPALAADRNRLTLAWYTAVRNEPRVYLVQSRDAGETFDDRIRIDEGRTLGRVDILPLDDGSVMVGWLEGKSDADAEWRIRRVNAAGRVGPSRAIATVPRARLAGFPRLARSGRDLLFAYTATGPQGGVRVVRVDPASSTVRE